MTTSRLGDTALITIFGTLGALSIGIIFSYSSLPPWSMYIAIPSILVMWFVLLWISPLPEKIKKINDMKRHNTLAREFFQKFKQEKFVDSFKKIQSTDSDGIYLEYTFHNIIGRLKQHHQEFGSLPDPEINLIRENFTFWRRWYGYFDNKKIDFNSFSTMLEEFGFIVRGYHRICILEPLRKISRINGKNNIKINEEIQRDWKIAMGYYDDFEKRYNHFVEEVNGGFKEPILSGLPPAQELCVGSKEDIDNQKMH